MASATLRCLAGTALAFLSACTAVRIQNADVTERSYAGITFLTITPREGGASVVSTTGIGLTFSVSSAAIGYLEESQVFTSNTSECRVFILVKDKQDVQALRLALERRELRQGICVVDTSGASHDR